MNQSGDDADAGRLISKKSQNGSLHCSLKPAARQQVGNAATMDDPHVGHFIYFDIALGNMSTSKMALVCFGLLPVDAVAVVNGDMTLSLVCAWSAATVTCRGCFRDNGDGDLPNKTCFPLVLGNKEASSLPDSFHPDDEPTFFDSMVRLRLHSNTRLLMELILLLLLCLTMARTAILEAIAAATLRQK